MPLTGRAAVAGESEAPNKVPEIRESVRKKVEEWKYFLKYSEKNTYY